MIEGRPHVTRYAIPVPPTVALPIAGSEDFFPVRRVYCIGRNYAAHAVEMGHDPDRDPPFFFQKNPDDLDPSGRFPYPCGSSDVHHEAEIAVMLHSGGIDIATGDALGHVFGYALALDMTQRDLQDEAKRLARPWEVAKAFERSAPVGPIHPAADVGHPADGPIVLRVNGAVRQKGDLNQMIWKVPETVATLSTRFRLAAGDVILTGTPSGVGPVSRGDVMELTCAPLGRLTVTVG